MANNLEKVSATTHAKVASMQKARQMLAEDVQALVASSPLTIPTATDTTLAALDPGTRERIQRYRAWLDKHALYERTRDHQRERDDYAREATRIEQLDELKIATFAPFHPRLSALQTFTGFQLLLLSLLALIWLFGLYKLQLHLLSDTIAVVTLLYTLLLLLDLVLVIRLFRGSSTESIDDVIVQALHDAEWPMYTILCPLYREAPMVAQFVEAIQALDYPPERLQVLLLTEENDSETRQALRALDPPAHFTIIVVPDGQPRTKPRACNYGLLATEGSYVVIYDAEDIPDPLQLKKAVLTFAHHGTNLACVQAKLNFYNTRQNLLTRWFAAEYSLWFDIVLPSLQRARFPIPLGGTSNHFRVDVLRALGAWDAYNVTEDCDLGLRLKRYKLETVILDSTTREEANPRLGNWLRQRSRWIKGYMQTYLVHMRHPLAQIRKGGLYEMLALQVVVGSCLGVMLFNPLLWTMLLLSLTSSPETINLYHLLFLGPVLYLAAFCLIFGNFFYLYLYLVSCARRKLYHLVPGALLIPFYWLLMSAAAGYALLELLVKPHYWQKTIHGFHLKKRLFGAQIQISKEENASLREATLPTPVISADARPAEAISSVTESLKALPKSALSPLHVRGEAQHTHTRDLWQVATLIVACLCSIGACGYFFTHHDLLLYQDALSHMRIARSVFDNLTPGLAQLGSVWLPLPHILMWPFIWNNYLWQSGLAGSFAAMPCYVLAALYVFRSARVLTQNSAAAFVGTLAFILNPNVLYLQSTPLSETVCMATLTMTCYYFFRWIQDGTLKMLVFMAGCTFLATLARYDGWALFAALSVLLPLIGLFKRFSFARIISNSILFSLPGGLGIALWFAWNKLIFGDPLYFQSSIYSSQAQQQLQLQLNRLFAYHNLWEALRFYALDTLQSAGIILCALAMLGLLWFLFSRRSLAQRAGLLVLLVPFAFYVLAQYTGQAIIWLPAAVPASAHVTFYNVRYGSQMIAPLSILLAVCLANLHLPSRKSFNTLLYSLCIGVLLFQNGALITQGVISLQDGEDNYACGTALSVANYLAQHYQGGLILEDLFANQVDPTLVRADFKEVVYEGSGPFWAQALHYPASTVTWIIARPDNPADLVTRSIDLQSPAFLSNFTIVAQQSDGVVLYHHLGTPLTPLHTGVPKWNVPHDSCP